MSLTGKNTLSLKRQDVKEQKSIAVGFKKIQFAHKATLGDTGINLGALLLPTEMSGFTNPSPAELLAAQLFFYRKNFTLISSIRGVLIDYMSYNVVSSTQVTFNGFTAADGEIFTGIIDASARTGVNLVDAAPLVSTGTLAIAATDFNVGQMFEINKYSSSQVGAVVVYRNGMQQFRNTNNSAVTLDGNYYEVNNGSGTGQIIRFNTAPSVQADSILVVSNGLMAYNPDGSALQMIESLSGKIDSMVPTLATLAGVPEANFGGVSNVDLKSFGDQVQNYENRIDALEADGSVTTARLANSAVTTAKIADSNVTTAKIADSNVTTAKIAAVTQQISASCGAFGTASTTFVAVTNLSVTIPVTSGKLVVISLISDGSGNNSYIQNGSSGGGLPEAIVRIMRGATEISRERLLTTGSTSLVITRWPVSSIHTVDIGAVGPTATYSVEMLTTAETSYLHYAKLVAYELK